VGAETLPAYWLCHLKAGFEVSKYVRVSAGVENLLDTYYEIREGSPQAGRTYTLSLTISN
jgi:iron complex outermembrane receptor protein